MRPAPRVYGIGLHLDKSDLALRLPRPAVTWKFVGSGAAS